MRRFYNSKKTPVFNAVAANGFAAETITKFLTLSVSGSNAAIEAMLAEHGPALLEARDDKGRTALYCAAEDGHSGAINALIRNGAEIDARDDGGRTPLMIAAKKGFKAIVEALLDREAGMNQWDHQGQTVLHHAATHRNNNDHRHPMSHAKKETISLLLERGARTDMRDNQGHTAAEWAKRHGYGNVAEVIQSEELRRLDEEKGRISLFTDGIPDEVTMMRLKLRYRRGFWPG
jgi:ankyrin repeat protein